jgi:hypothetical protein
MGLLHKAAVETGAGPKEPEPSPPEAVWEEIDQWYNGNPFSGVIFESPGEEGFQLRLTNISAFFGVVVSLPAGRSLLLFSHSLDQELIVHRLSRSLKTSPLAVFEAENPLEAAEQLRGFV